jgi:hypothetical protein
MSTTRSRVREPAPAAEPGFTATLVHGQTYHLVAPDGDRVFEHGQPTPISEQVAHRLATAATDLVTRGHSTDAEGVYSTERQKFLVTDPPPVLSLVRRQTRAELRREEDAATAALTPRVQAALAREHLNTDALRAALLSAMPVISRLHTVRHPSGTYGDRWHQFSSEVLARTYVGYEACVARSLAKLGIRRSVGPAGYLSTDRDRELAADLSLPDEELPIMALNERRIARALATPPRAWEDLPDPHAD